MEYVNEIRDPKTAERFLNKLKEITTRPWNIMETCGDQTLTILKNNIQNRLPEKIRIIHGPGCPAGVTPLEMIDKAILIAGLNDVIFTSFGDMLRVPGSKKDLLSVKSKGCDIRAVQSPLDAVKIAEENPGKRVVFFGVGFETNAPENAMSIKAAKLKKLPNYFILCSHLLLPPAIKFLLSDKESRIEGILAPGDMCSVMGYGQYIPIADDFRVPIVVTGFELNDILHGIYMTVKQLEEGKYEVENQYTRAVNCLGNLGAKEVMEDVFDVTDRKWRGIGVIPDSGYKITERYKAFDAEQEFKVESQEEEESDLCIAGIIMQGKITPPECPAFAKQCTPEHPLGAPMVSSKGACAAYFHYKRKDR
ncbi:MAG: hydrogenase formation protein HypD [Melioribacteraceae bacterium]|nr:hydrogenase formation protein HypD [Melioribacteraceae bacterium]